MSKIIVIPKGATSELLAISSALRKLKLLMELIYDPATDEFSIAVYSGDNGFNAERCGSAIDKKLPVAFQKALNALIMQGAELAAGD